MIATSSVVVDRPARASGAAPRALRRVAGVLFLPLVLLAAIGLRAHDLTRHCFWSDEVYTLESSAGHGLANKHFIHAGWVEKMPDLLSLSGPDARPWWAVATSLVRDDNHPPLYFMLVRWWRELFGDSDAAVRALSILFSVVAIAFLYDAVRLLHGLTAARWSAVLMAVAGPQIQFAQEARAYALLVMLGCAACAVIARIETRGATPRRLASLGIVSIAMMLTHYYAAAPLAALAAYALIRLPRPQARRVIAAFVVAGLTFLAGWGWALWRQRLNIAGNNWYIIEASPDHLARTLRRVLMAPVQFLFDPVKRFSVAGSLAAVLYVVHFLMYRRHKRLLLWGLWLTFSIGMVLLIDLLGQSRQLEFMRYTIAASPAVYVLIAAVLSEQRHAWMRHVLPLLATAGCLLSLGETYQNTQTPKPDWRIPAAVINAHLKPGDVFYFVGHERDPGVTDSLMLAHYVPKMPRTRIFSTVGPDRAMVDRLRRAKGVWIVAETQSGYGNRGPAGFVPTTHCPFVLGLPMIQRWAPAGSEALKSPASSAPSAPLPPAPAHPR